MKWTLFRLLKLENMVPKMYKMLFQICSSKCYIITCGVTMRWISFIHSFSAACHRRCPECWSWSCPRYSASLSQQVRVRLEKSLIYFFLHCHCLSSRLFLLRNHLGHICHEFYHYKSSLMILLRVSFKFLKKHKLREWHY